MVVVGRMYATTRAAVRNGVIAQPVLQFVLVITAHKLQTEELGNLDKLDGLRWYLLRQQWLG